MHETREESGVGKAEWGKDGNAAPELMFSGKHISILFVTVFCRANVWLLII